MMTRAARCRPAAAAACTMATRRQCSRRVCATMALRRRQQEDIPQSLAAQQTLHRCVHVREALDTSLILRALRQQAYWWAPSAPAVDLDAIRAKANTFADSLSHGPVATQAAPYGAPPQFMPPLRPWAAGASRAPAAPQAFASAAPRRQHVQPKPAPRGGVEDDPIELLDSDSDAPPPPPPPPPPAADDDEVVVVEGDEISAERR